MSRDPQSKLRIKIGKMEVAYPRTLLEHGVACSVGNVARWATLFDAVHTFGMLPRRAMVLAYPRRQVLTK